MPFRTIKDTLRTSKNVNELSDFQFRVWVHLITYVDDFGRGSADSEILRNLLFPRRNGVTVKQIKDAVGTLASKGMVTLYDYDGEPYFYFPKWGLHQRIRTKVSKFPDPPAVGGNSPQIAADCGNSPQIAAKNQNQKPEPETYKREPEPAAHAHAQDDQPVNDLGRVMTFFMDKINPTPSGMCVEMLKSYTASLGADVVLHVFGIAIDEHKTGWSYIKAILSRYEREGLRTLEAVLQSEQRHDAGKKPQETPPKPKKQERPVDMDRDLVEYPEGSGFYRPYWEVPGYDGGN